MTGLVRFGNKCPGRLGSRMNTGVNRSLCAAVLALTVGTDTVWAQPTDQISQPIEQCIRTNAPTIEQAVPSLTEAVDFLVADLCAKPIAEEYWSRQKAVQDKMFAELRRRCAQLGKSGQKSDDAALETTCATSDVTEDAATGWTIFAPQPNKPARETSLAAQIPLELRIARLNANHTQGSH